MSTSERLERLLYVLPRAAQPGGARIDDLARALDVSAAAILADIEEATTRVFYHPPATVDSFNLVVEDDVVRLFGSEFNRPVRLTEREAMALGLGLRVLATEADTQRRSEILALAARLEKELTTPPIELQPMLADRVTVREMPMLGPERELDVVFGEDDFRGAITGAIDTRVFCDVVYLKAGGSDPAERRIAPVRLLYTRGHWYVRAYEEDSEQLRMYRLDRILELHLTAERHDFTDMPAEQTFVLNEARAVKVRYSPQVARWVAEREDAQCEADGTLVLTHDVADMNWLVRHVLQYGGEAVVETPELREAVVRAVGGPTLHM